MNDIDEEIGYLDLDLDLQSRFTIRLDVRSLDLARFWP